MVMLEPVQTEVVELEGVGAAALDAEITVAKLLFADIPQADEQEAE